MMPTDVAHYGRATEPVMAPTVLSPRSILVHCTLARSENGAPVPAHVWLALQLNLRTPVLCVKPSNDPIDVIFFKALELPEKKLPERDATGRGWKLFIKTRVHGKADEFNSETIRLSPITSQTSDQQLDDVVAAIREFRAQALAAAAATKAGHQGPANKLDFQHLLASPDGDSRDDLPKCFTQSSVQTSALEVGSPFYVSPQAAGLYQPHYCAVPDDMYFYKCEDPAADSFPAQGCGDGLASYASALPSLSSQSDEERSESSSSEEDGDEDSVAPVCRWWQISRSKCVASPHAFSRAWREWNVLEEWWFRWRNLQKEINYRRFMGKVIEDTSDSECDLPRPSTQDFQIPKRYGSDCSSCSDDSIDSFGEDIWERNQMLSWRIEYEAQLNATRAQQPRRAACHITINAADLEGTWELPSLAESDCAGELELIRYTVCTSAMAFEDSAAAAVSWERSLSSVAINHY